MVTPILMLWNAFNVCRRFNRPIWYRSKDNIAPAIDAGKICLAKDPLYALDGWPGSKQFCAFPSLAP